ncbi:MAG: HEAT repeat domain-containing protein [Bacteroidales bacterium]|nr:HEAT repeat domain-containing protein [Bacteroidales bacterium]
MPRLLVRAAVIGLCGGLAGCASNWEAATSRDFKEHPFQSLFGKTPDPLHVLRTSPEGYARAKAMKRLEEPLRSGGTQEDQDEVVDHILGPAATSDPSPVVRAAAIDALSRFEDERATRYLIAAYHQADGGARDAVLPTTTSPIQQVGLNTKSLSKTSSLADGLGLHGPSGFPNEVTASLRSKVIVGLARKVQPETVRFLTAVATGADASTPGAADRDCRMAAVRALGTMKTKESVIALNTVLASEKSKDVALAGRAHEGLVQLTGKDVPPDPEEWSKIVQAGFELPK